MTLNQRQKTMIFITGFTVSVSHFFPSSSFICPPLLVSQVLQECISVLLPLAGLNIGQFLHLTADKVPELLNPILHPPPQLLLSGPGTYNDQQRHSACVTF